MFATRHRVLSGSVQSLDAAQAVMTQPGLFYMNFWPLALVFIAEGAIKFGDFLVADQKAGRAKLGCFHGAPTEETGAISSGLDGVLWHQPVLPTGP
jgi:hypothetical protein